jgi:UDP-N-acetylmuramoyl-tripeptide--D-alanyl-D-alanine ligase
MIHQPKPKPPWRRWLDRTREMARFRPRTFLGALAWPLLFPAAWLWRRTGLRGTRLIAVTGSLGKTSTTAAAAAVLAAAANPDARNFGSFLALALLRHGSRGPRRRPLVVEVGISRRGQMGRYARLLRPDVVLLTAVTDDHGRALGGIAGVAAEKARLAHALRPGGLLLVNGDDPRCRAIAASAASTHARTLKVGFAEDCEWRIESVRVDFPRGTEVRLAGPDGVWALASPWIGEELARATALAAAVGADSGLGYDRVRDGLAALRPIPERLEAVALPSGAWLLCDSWRSTPETIESALSELGRLTGWRRIAVLGNLDELPEGTQTAAYLQYARRAAAVAERILYLGNGFEKFARGTRQSGLAPGRLQSCRDVHQAAAELAPELAPGTVILIKGSHRQKLGRVRLLLQGIAVRCDLRTCPRTGLSCRLCPNLEKVSEGESE